MTRTMRAGRSLTALAAILVATSVGLAPQSVAAPLAAHVHPAKGHAAPASAPSQSGASASDFASIFAGDNANLAGSGWQSCASPVQWTVDTRGLNEAESASQIKNLEWAFTEWSKASGLTFEFAGEEDVTYDDDAFTVTPADGSDVETRHVYLDFVNDNESARLGGGTVGLGSPSQVMPTTKEIVSGEAVFRTDHVQGATAKEAKSLYLHELGHVLGLAHAQVESNIMYPMVTDHLKLGAGDVTGIKTMTQPCASQEG
jgi:hypothetical protein